MLCCLRLLDSEVCETKHFFFHSTLKAHICVIFKELWRNSMYFNEKKNTIHHYAVIDCIGGIVCSKMIHHCSGSKGSPATSVQLNPIISNLRQMYFVSFNLIWPCGNHAVIFFLVITNIPFCFVLEFLFKYVIVQVVVHLIHSLHTLCTLGIE